jgi:hypothetical protein
MKSTGAMKRVIAGMATMPSRAATFPIAFKSIITQVDSLYLYLDGHLEVPEAARNHPRVVPIFSSEFPGLASDGKFAGMYHETEPCLYLTVDDDIEYPPNYVCTLRTQLEAEKGRAVVGYHGSLLHRSLKSYRYDRRFFFFGNGLDQSVIVDVLGTGTTMFDTALLKFDFRRWQHVNRNDLYFAIEAAKVGIPLICLAREHGFLRPIATEQADSIFARLKIDDSRETMLAIELQRLRSKTINRTEGL